MNNMSTQLTIKNKSLSISISLINEYDKGYFEIQSSDTQRDIQFYESVFGWKLIKEDFAPIEYYRIQTNSISGELLKRPAKCLRQKVVQMHLCALCM